MEFTSPQSLKAAMTATKIVETGVQPLARSSRDSSATHLQAHPGARHAETATKISEKVVTTETSTTETAVAFSVISKLATSVQPFSPQSVLWFPFRLCAEMEDSKALSNAMTETWSTEMAATQAAWSRFLLQEWQKQIASWTQTWPGRDLYAFVRPRTSKSALYACVLPNWLSSTASVHLCRIPAETESTSQQSSKSATTETTITETDATRLALLKTDSGVWM